MGRRSGVPHRDEELAGMTDDEIAAEIWRSRIGLSKGSKQWKKRLHWLEAVLINRG
jgi:hypothetical protein